MQFSVQLAGMSPFSYPAAGGVYAPDGKLTRPTQRFVCDAANAQEARELFCRVLGVRGAEGKFTVSKAKGSAPQGEAPAAVAGDPELVPVSEVREAFEAAGERIREAEARAEAAEARLRELEAPPPADPAPAPEAPPGQE